ncbi:MAG: hypothetical protein JNK02_07510 [Planctomycetes bacterium]|nr:hypothetical protein [Planctomycetota bacterium]
MAETRGMNPVEFLRNASRNSPWVMIAIALHLIVIAGAAIFYTAFEPPAKVEEAVTMKISDRSREEEEIILPPETIDRKSIPKNEEAELVSFEEDVYIPTTEAVPEDLFQDRGDPLADATGGTTGGTAIGVGTVGHAGLRPTPFGGRKLGTGPRKGRAGGPTQATERAVLDGLRWLARHQNEDGSWSPSTLKERCDCDDPAYNPKKPYVTFYDTGLTGLALLCFLGAGFSHESKQDLVDTSMGKRYKIGDIVKKGLQWLVKGQNPDGSFSKERVFMYNEALATMAVTEAFGLTQARFWRDPAQKALNFLQAAQRPSPQGTGLWGWRYASRQEIEQFHRGAGSQDTELLKELYDSDTSVTGWAIMALKSGQLSGLDVNDDNMKGGMAFARFVTQLGGDGKPTGLVGYLDAKGAGAKVTGPHDHFTYHPAVMSALGMCIRIFSEHDPDDPFLRVAADQIIKDLPTISKDKLSLDYYYWYYASLALNQLDGPDAPKKTNRHWGPWNKAMVDALLPLQDKKERSCTNGGWMDLDRWSFDHGGPLYTTAINVLTLQVYYRYENAFGAVKVTNKKKPAAGSANAPADAAKPN